MLDEDEGVRGVRKNLLQQRLALQERHIPQVIAIEIEKIERVVVKPGAVRPAEFAPQLLEVRQTVAAVNHRLAVDDGGLSFELRSGSGNRGELIGPIEPGAGVHSRVVGREVKLGTVAVGLDLEHPTRPVRWTIPLRGIAELDEARQGSLKRAGNARERTRTQRHSTHAHSMGGGAEEFRHELIC